MAFDPKPNSYERAAPPEFGSVLGQLLLVDASSPPKNNARLLKLGSYWQTMGAAVVFADPKTNRVIVGNGITSVGQYPTERTIFPFEPDNWLLLFHDDGGILDRVWAQRSIVDATHDTGSKKNRSTRITDQEKEQQYGLLSDVIKIVESNAKETDKQIRLNKAGLPFALASGGQDVRGAAAINIARNAYVSDGKEYAPWAHILTFLHTGGTQASGTGNRAKKKGELGIHATAGFKDGGLVYSLPTPEKTPPNVRDEGDPHLVHFILKGVGSDVQDTAIDEKNNQDAIGRHAWPRLGGYVRLSPGAYPPDHWDDSYHGYPSNGMPSSGGSGPSEGGSPAPDCSDGD